MAKKKAAKKSTAKKAKAKKPAKKAAKKKPAAKKGAKRAAAAKRTTHRSKSGKKLYAKRTAKGTFKDIQTFKRAHGQDLDRKSGAERAMGGSMSPAEAAAPPAVSEAALNAPWTTPATPGG